jgi:hypothetical protein
VTWLAILLGSGPTSVTPVDSAAQSIIGYITGFGALGITSLALAFGWLKPGRTTERDREQARTEARGDLEKELARVIAEKRDIEEQRDAAQAFAQEQMVPLLTQFVATTAALIPLLQEIVREQERHGGGRSR